MKAADARPVAVIGGAGFIGSNLAHQLARDGHPVRVLDNLSRAGVQANLDWLRAEHGDRVEVSVDDVRDRAALRSVIQGAGAVFHLASQVAVTTSLEDPVHDFEVNLRGTLNVLEELRALAAPPPLVFTSTNKVYGCLPDLDLAELELRYQPRDPALAGRGVGEGRNLEFRSPYGCSKGAADQYVLDYARTYGLPAAVARMSCIYGPRQFGTEDQGWVAHFLIKAIEGSPITIYGDGKQVRDVLYVDDLVDGLRRLWRDIDRLSGRAFNIGGGPANAVSLLEILNSIESLRGHRPEVRFEDWRPGDQLYYVSDTTAFAAATGWRARVPAAEGVRRLHEWLLGQHRRAARAPAAGGEPATLSASARRVKNV